MRLSEIILLMIDELGGKVSSKTKIHKLYYFYSIFTGKDLGFKPYHYGPYSPSVERTLDELEGIGLIEKDKHRIGEGYGGFEIVRYDYSINEYGKQVLKSLTGTDTEVKSLEGFVLKIKELGDPDYFELSIAAKAHYVLQREGKPLTVSGIQDKAKNFGWNISSKAMDKAIKLLESFELTNYEEANGLHKEIQEIKNKYTINTHILSKYEESIKEEKDVSADNVKQIYKEAGLIFPESVVKKIKDTLEFHKTIVLNRKDYLKSEIARIKREIEQQKYQIETLSNKRAELQGVPQGRE